MKALLLAHDGADAQTVARVAQALVRAGFDDIVAAGPAAGVLASAAPGARLRTIDAGPGEAAAIVAALPLLGDAPFLAVRADMPSPAFDFKLAQGTLEERDATGKPYAPDERDVAWIYLLPAGPGGENGVAMTLYALSLDGEPRHGWAGVAVLRPEAFDGCDARGTLLDALRPQIARGRVGGEVLPGLVTPLTPALKGNLP